MRGSCGLPASAAAWTLSAAAQATTATAILRTRISVRLWMRRAPGAQ